MEIFNIGSYSTGGFYFGKKLKWRILYKYKLPINTEDVEYSWFCKFRISKKIIWSTPYFWPIHKILNPQNFYIISTATNEQTLLYRKIAPPKSQHNKIHNQAHTDTCQNGVTSTHPYSLWCQDCSTGYPLVNVTERRIGLVFKFCVLYNDGIYGDNETQDTQKTVKRQESSCRHVDFSTHFRIL